METSLAPLKGDRPSPLEILLTLFAMSWILLIRCPDVISHPQFWAEDGSVFYLEQRALGWASLWQTYVGYYHLIPRLIAQGASYFDPIHAPMLYIIGAWLIWLSVGALCLYSRFEVSARMKIAMALALVLVPHGGETFLNPTNTNWPICVAFAILLVQPSARSATLRAIELLLVALLCLSTPGAAFLLPWVGLRWLLIRRHRTLTNFLMISAASVASGIQVLSSLIQTRVGLRPSFNDPADWLQTIGPNFFAPLLAGAKLPDLIPGLAILATVAGLCGLLFCLLHHARLGNSTAWIWCAYAFTLFAAGIYASHGTPSSFVPFFIGRERYHLAPYVLLTWVILGVVFSQPPARWRAGGFAMLLAILLASASAFVRNPLHRHNWHADVRAVRAGEMDALSIIAPPGQTNTLTRDDLLPRGRAGSR